MKETKRKKRKFLLLMCLIIFAIACIFIVFLFAKKQIDGNTPQREDIVSEIVDVDIETTDTTNEGAQTQEIIHISQLGEYLSNVKPIETVDVSNDYKDFQIGVNGNKYKLPISIKTFSEDNGFEVLENESETFYPGHWENASIYKDGEVIALTVLVNRNAEDSNFKDCEIAELTQTYWDKAIEPENLIIFPGGAHIGMQVTEQELIEMYGEPDYRYDVEEYQQELEARYGVDENDQRETYYDTTYEWYDDDNADYPDMFRINVRYGVIAEIRMRNLFALEDITPDGTEILSEK